jgi:ribose transport system substrate-binding protein
VQDKVVIAMDTDADTLDWIQKGVIAATIAQKPYTMAKVGLHMLDDLHHNQAGRLNGDWSKDSFAPVPAFVDTGTALIDKTNVESFRQERAKK